MWMILGTEQYHQWETNSNPTIIYIKWYYGKQSQNQSQPGGKGYQKVLSTLASPGSAHTHTQKKNTIFYYLSTKHKPLVQNS